MKSFIMKYLGIAMLFMTACTVDALNSTSRAYCRVYPDPHFTTVRPMRNFQKESNARFASMPTDLSTLPFLYVVLTVAW
jgi:outer membrane biogenesis lipoprotein LolB